MLRGLRLIACLAMGAVPCCAYRQSQVAATLLKSIGLRADFSARADEPIDALFESGAR
jgi:hypothetical protein